MITRLIGDIHGYYVSYFDIVRNGPGHSIQVGDMGVGFGNKYKDEKLNKQMILYNGFFIAGNHDNPSECKKLQNNIKAGVWNNLFAVPGAWSIDHAYRTVGIDWWEDEELSIPELNQVIMTYNLVKPKVMITHDGPHEVTKQLFIDKGLGLGNVSYKTKTGQALQVMFEVHQPKVWVFGHWHVDTNEVINGTKFICLGECSWIDIDLDTQVIYDSSNNDVFIKE